MSNHMDVVFSPDLYLDRDKKAIAFVEDRLRHQESCAAVCMAGNGKDYLFANVLKCFERPDSPYLLKVLNTVSSDELRDFADMLEADESPTLCLLNLRVGKDVSWFIHIIERLYILRGHAFVTFVCSYIGDIYDALAQTAKPVTHSLYILKRIPYEDAVHIIDELSERFEFQPSHAQKQDIYRWSYGHVGMLRTLFLLKRQFPDKQFTASMLLSEPTVIERLNHILMDVPAEKLHSLTAHRLSFVEQMLLKEFGYIDDSGNLFHPLLAELSARKAPLARVGLSVTERRVLTYLRTHAGSVVSRSDIAQIIWGEEEWEDKYSDWAIGQLIYRLRKKLDYDAEPGVIETRKGRGFAYSQSPARKA